MIDRDQIRRDLFETYGIRIDMNDPMMISLLINEALWVQMEPAIEGIYARAGQASKVLGEEVIVEGAKAGATEVGRSVHRANQVLEQRIGLSIKSLNSAQVTMRNIVGEIQTYYDEMFKMYAFLIYLSTALGAGIGVGLFFIIGDFMGWL